MSRLNTSKRLLHYLPLVALGAFLLGVILGYIPFGYKREANFISVKLDDVQITKETEDRMDGVAIQRIAKEIHRNPWLPPLLFPIVDGVNVQWNEIYSPRESTYRRLTYSARFESLRDRRFGERVGTQHRYHGVTPEVIHKLAEKAKEGHIRISDCKEYGCTIDKE